MKKSNVISLSKFLARYANLTGKDLVNLTHDEVKVLFPQIKRTSFDYVDEHQDEMASGKVALVSDGKKVVPYFVPEYDFEHDVTEVVRPKDEPIKRDDTDYDYTKLSIYELRTLLRRKFSTQKNQYRAARELERRGVVLHKKYNRRDYKKGESEE